MAKIQIDNNTNTWPISRDNGSTDTLLNSGPQGVSFEHGWSYYLPPGVSAYTHSNRPKLIFVPQMSPDTRIVLV
jgi:hypothetical protein